MTGFEQRIVSSAAQVADNVMTYNREVGQSPALRKRIAMHRAWYAVRGPNSQWCFAPSKFVGYVDNSAQVYLASYDSEGGLDGKETEPALKAWFEEVPEKTPLWHELHRAFAAFAAKHGKAPSRVWRVSVERHLLVALTERPSTLLEDRSDKIDGRVTSDPAICGGRPIIRGTRMRVSDIVEMIASGAEHEVILADYPYLSQDDLRAALRYAAQSVDHRVIRAA